MTADRYYWTGIPVRRRGATDLLPLVPTCQPHSRLYKEAYSSLNYTTPSYCLYSDRQACALNLQAMDSSILLVTLKGSMDSCTTGNNRTERRLGQSFAFSRIQHQYTVYVGSTSNPTLSLVQHLSFSLSLYTYI